MTSIRHNGLDSARPPDDSARPPDDSARPPDDSARPSRTPDDGYLDAAREAILAVGWSRTTLTDIARRAGVSRMTLYRRWPDMQTMLADLMTREWGRVAGESVDLTGATQERASAGDALRRITDGVVATVRGLRANELLRRIIDVDPELLLPYLLDRRGRSQELVATALAALIREGQADGSIREGDADRLARSLLLACHGFTLSAHTMVDDPATGSECRGAPSRDVDVTEFDTELALLVARYLEP